MPLFRQQIVENVLFGEFPVQPVVEQCHATLQARMVPVSSAPAVFALHHPQSGRPGLGFRVAAASAAFDLQNETDERNTGWHRLAQIHDKYDSTVRYVHFESAVCHCRCPMKLEAGCFRSVQRS